SSFAPAEHGFGGGFTTSHAQALQVGDERVFFRLALQGFGSGSDLLIGVRNAQATQCTHAVLYVGAFHGVVLQPGIGRHVGLLHHRPRVAQVDTVPVIRVALTDAGQVATGTLGAPQEGVGVHRLTRQRVGAVALNFGAQHAALLRVAADTAFADIDVPADQT